MLEYDPFRYYADPYVIFRRLRDEAPLYHNPDREFRALSRYEDVYAASQDWTTYSSAYGNDLDDTYTLWRPGSPESVDPPAHDRLRAVVQRHFSPRGSADLSPESEPSIGCWSDTHASDRPTSQLSWPGRRRSP
jgi:cytochrome P450